MVTSISAGALQTRKENLKPTISGVVHGVTDFSRLSDSDQANILPRLRVALQNDEFQRIQHDKYKEPSTRELISKLQNLSMGTQTQDKPSHTIAAMFNGDSLRTAGGGSVPVRWPSKALDYSQLSGSERLYQYLTSENGLFSKNPELGKSLYQKIKEGAQSEKSDDEICIALRAWYNKHAEAVTEALNRDDNIRVKSRTLLFQNFIHALPGSILQSTTDWKRKESQILDVGCSGMEGTRSMVAGLLDAGVNLSKVYGIDIYRAAHLDQNCGEINKLKTPSGKSVQATPLLYEGDDHCTIPPQAQGSKIITAMSVLHHVTKPGQLDKLLRSIHQSLDKDGIFIVRELIADDMTTKIFNLIPELKFYRAFEQLPVPMDVNCYRSVDQWKDVIERNGFKLITVDHNPKHPFEPAMMVFSQKEKKPSK